MMRLLQIFTDGSVKKPVPWAGCAFVVYNRDLQKWEGHMATMGQETESINAEKTAILGALHWMFDHRNQADDFVIVTDCKHAIYEIIYNNTGQWESPNHIDHQIYDAWVKVQHSGGSIQFQHIKAHQGSDNLAAEGNRHADELARRASTASRDAGEGQGLVWLPPVWLWSDFVAEDLSQPPLALPTTLTPYPWLTERHIRYFY